MTDNNTNTIKRWDDLNLRERGEMMKVAIRRGVTDLHEIKRAYNEFAEGGYIYANGGSTYTPPQNLRRDIATWEGSSMKENRSFEAEAKDFNRVIPKGVRDKLSQDQLNALYSYGYNVGMGNLKKRVLPTLERYVNGQASSDDVAMSMWASKDMALRGLQRRRNWERSMFTGKPYNSPQNSVAFNPTGSAANYGYNPNGSLMTLGNSSAYNANASQPSIFGDDQMEEQVEQEPTWYDEVLQRAKENPIVYDQPAYNPVAPALSPLVNNAQSRADLLASIFSHDEPADNDYTFGLPMIGMYANGGHLFGDGDKIARGYNNPFFNPFVSPALNDYAVKHLASQNFFQVQQNKNKARAFVDMVNKPAEARKAKQNNVKRHIGVKRVELQERVRPNTSPTAKRSEMVENYIKDGLVEKANAYGLSNSGYDIPYIPSKVININGNSVSTNQLDSLAKYWGWHNANPQLSQFHSKKAKTRLLNKNEMLGLARQETMFGAVPWVNIGRKGNNFSDREIANANYLKAYGSVPSEFYIRNYNYDESGVDRSTPPLLDGFRYYAQGDYNRGDKNHTSDVNRAGAFVWSLPVIQQWWRDSGQKWAKIGEKMGK